MKLNRIVYVFKRLLKLDYTAMKNRVKEVSKKANKNPFLIWVDMIICGFRYSAGYEDYVLFEFYKIKGAKRSTYITRGINNQLVRKLNSQKNYWYYMDDKSVFNEVFNDFIGREWIDLRKADVNTFLKWVKDKEEIIAKPISGTHGKGIKKIKKSNFKNEEALYEYIKLTGAVLVEEVIQQHEAVSKIYSDSVNTIRMVTILDNDTVYIPFSCMRIGNGRIVDNLNHGGMAALVDVDSGKIVRPGTDKKGVIYAEHPITGQKLEGFEIPLWDKCIELVKDAAKRVPEIKYTGWDVAITPAGPILIEANQFPGHDIYQLPAFLNDNMGMLPKFKEIISI